MSLFSPVPSLSSSAPSSTCSIHARRRRKVIEDAKLAGFNAACEFAQVPKDLKPAERQAAVTDGLEAALRDPARAAGGCWLGLCERHIAVARCPCLAFNIARPLTARVQRLTRP
jgi:hypothetical protein